MRATHKTGFPPLFSPLLLYTTNAGLRKRKVGKFPTLPGGENHVFFSFPYAMALGKILNKNNGEDRNFETTNPEASFTGVVTFAFSSSFCFLSAYSFQTFH